MKKAGILLISLLLLTPSMAAVFKADESISINADEVINDNAYYAGNTITINGVINGDLVIAGNNIQVNGVINGDLWTVGNSIVINGNVTGDLRTGAGSISINGLINGELLAGAGQVSLNQGSSTGSANIGAGSATINGEVKGNLTINSDSVTINNNALIHGHLNYTSNNDAVISSNDSIMGVIQKNLPKESNQAWSGGTISNLWGYFSIISFLINIVTILVMGVVLLKVSEKNVLLFKKEMNHQYIDNLIKGFAVLVLVPIASVIVLFTIIGIPLSLITIALYAIGLYLSFVLASFWVGEQVIQLLKIKKQVLIVELFTGALVLNLIKFIPLIGWFLNLVIWLMGVGVLLKIVKQGFNKCKKKKIC